MKSCLVSKTTSNILSMLLKIMYKDCKNVSSLWQYKLFYKLSLFAHILCPMLIKHPDTNLYCSFDLIWFIDNKDITKKILLSMLHMVRTCLHSQQHVSINVNPSYFRSPSLPILIFLSIYQISEFYLNKSK